MILNTDTMLQLLTPSIISTRIFAPRQRWQIEMFSIRNIDESHTHCTGKCRNKKEFGGICPHSYQLQRSSQERMCRCLQNISLFIGYEYRYIKYGWWCDVHCSEYYLGRLLPALLICCQPHSLLWTLSTELLSSREYISHCHNHVLPTLTATISNN